MVGASVRCVAHVADDHECLPGFVGGQGFYTYQAARTQIDLSLRVGPEEDPGQQVRALDQLSPDATNEVTNQFVKFEKAVFDQYKPGRSSTCLCVRRSDQRSLRRVHRWPALFQGSRCFGNATPVLEAFSGRLP